MESVDLSEPANGKLEVFKDAFAPQQPSRIIRAWERAPVPATLPRLQGQKIWKRAGVQSHREQDKENFEAAQHELRTEGTGARKRARLLGAKENIGDATWSRELELSGIIGEAFVAGAKGSASLEVSTAASVPLNNTDVNALQFVPRKRTNANRVVTPRKPMRQTTLNGHAKSQAFIRSPHPSPEGPRKRKSMRKSIRKSIAERISDVPAMAVGKGNTTQKRDTVESLETSPGKATIVDHSIIEQPEADSEKPTSQDAGHEVSLEKSTNEEPDTNPQPEFSTKTIPVASQSQSEANNEIADRLLNDKLNILFELTDAGAPTSQKPRPELDQDPGKDGKPFISSVEKASQATKVPLNDSPDHVETPLSSSQRGFSEEPETESIRLTDLVKTQPPRGRQVSETPSIIIPSIEMDTDSGAEQQASKTTNTPKRKRGASQRRGTLRSTRTTRTSSAEERTVPVEPAAMPSDVSTDELARRESASRDHDAERKLQTTDCSESANIVEVSQPPQNEKAVDVLEVESTFPDLQESVPVPSSLLASVATHLEVTEMPEISFNREDDVELEEFDVSAQLSLQLCGDSQQHHIIAEDFELQPVSASATMASSDGLSDGRRQESIYESPAAFSPPAEGSLEDSSPVRFSPINKLEALFTPESEQISAEVMENLDTALITTDSESMANESETMSPTTDDLTGSSTPDPTTSQLVETISENAQAVAYDHDETDMLRNFLDRVQANKAAKASTNIPKRKRSLPHSPLQLPLGDTTNISPSPHKTKEDFDVFVSGPSPSKRRKANETVVAEDDDTITERKPSRRSGRTRLPVIKASLGAPSHIPVRRLGQDGDATVTLKRTEEKKLAALTRLNTLKNKAGSQSVPEFLAKKVQEKEDPALRQRLLKEVFDEKSQKANKDRRKTVVWAEELTQYQIVEGRNADGGKEETKATEKTAAADEKKGAVKVGIRSKIALGMVVNGTPAPKRKRRAP